MESFISLKVDFKVGWENNKQFIRDPMNILKLEMSYCIFRIEYMSKFDNLIGISSIITYSMFEFFVLIFDIGCLTHWSIYHCLDHIFKVYSTLFRNYICVCILSKIIIVLDTLPNIYKQSIHQNIFLYSKTKPDLS